MVYDKHKMVYIQPEYNDLERKLYPFNTFQIYNIKFGYSACRFLFSFTLSTD